MSINKIYLRGFVEALNMRLENWCFIQKRVTVHFSSDYPFNPLKVIFQDNNGSIFLDVLME